MKQRRLRVLVLAEKANPNWISVPLVGWTHLQAIATFADVHLVTHVRNREDILSRGFSPQDVTFVSTGLLERYGQELALRLEGKSAMGGATQTAFQVPMYYQFEHRAWRMMAPRLRRGEFDVVHRVTPVSPVMPSPFAPRCARIGVPFVLGPLNGGVPWPRGVEALRRREGEWLSYLRGAHKLLPYYRATRRHASAILVGSAAVYCEVVESVPARKCFYMPENAVDPALFATTTESYHKRPLRVAFVGRLVAYKGAALLVRAAAPLIRCGELTLDIIGDGPERAALEDLVRSEAVEHGVRLDGWVPHKELQGRLSRSCVLGFPSVREFGGAVVLEAMMLGLVPVVIDYGGPGEVVSDDVGFRVPLGRSNEIIARLRAVLEHLVEAAPEELAMRGARGRAYVFSEYSVAAKAEKTREIYDWVTRRSAVRPILTPPSHALAYYRDPDSVVTREVAS